MGVVATLAFAAAIVGGFASLPGSGGRRPHHRHYREPGRPLRLLPRHQCRPLRGDHAGADLQAARVVRWQAQGEEGMSRHPTSDRLTPELLILTRARSPVHAPPHGSCARAPCRHRTAVPHDRLRPLHRGNLLLVFAVLSLGDAHRHRRGRPVLAGARRLLRPRHLYGRPSATTRSACRSSCNIVAGGLVAALCGFAIGFLSLRMRDIYLALSTFAFGEAMQWLFLNWTPVTGGPNGLDIQPRQPVRLDHPLGQGRPIRSWSIITRHLRRVHPRHPCLDSRAVVPGSPRSPRSPRRPSAST